MTKTFFIILTMVFLSQSINAQSPKEAKPSFDCAKATTRVEKMICSDSGGELQNLDKQLFESYQAIKAKLDKNDKKALLNSAKILAQDTREVQIQRMPKRAFAT